METIMGIRGSNFVIVAADTMRTQTIVVMKAGEKKIEKICNNIMCAASGDPAQTKRFVRTIKANNDFYRTQNNHDMNPKQFALYTRSKLADWLREISPLNVNLLIAGFDPSNKKPTLYYIDDVANGLDAEYCSHGYGGTFCQAIFDRHYNGALTEDEAYNVLKLCAEEIYKRLFLKFKRFKVAIIDENGMKSMPDINICPQ